MITSLTRMPAWARWAIYAALGVLLLTPEALIVRLIDSDPWTLALWRGVPCGAVIVLGYLAVARGRAVHELRCKVAFLEAAECTGIDM